MPVGKHLNALAASHMKRATMELGGHAPVLVFDDADVEGAAKLMGAFKYRNAGQVCVSPTRFFVHDKVYDNFVGKFIDIANKTKVGDGMEADSRMGPLANPRRINAIEAFVADAQDKGAKVAAGGKRIGNQGNFFQPTVLTDVPENARIMNEEPFGPVAVMLRFKETDDVLARANKLPFGLASYAFTKDAKTATKIADALDSRHGDHQPLRHRPARDAVRRRQGLGLRPRRRHRGPAGLHAGQVRQPPGLIPGHGCVIAKAAPYRVAAFGFFGRAFLAIGARTGGATSASNASSASSASPAMIALARVSIASTNLGMSTCVPAGMASTSAAAPRVSRSTLLASSAMRASSRGALRPTSAANACQCLRFRCSPRFLPAIFWVMLRVMPSHASRAHHVVDGCQSEAASRNHQ